MKKFFTTRRSQYQEKENKTKQKNVAKLLAKRNEQRGSVNSHKENSQFSCEHCKKSSGQFSKVSLFAFVTAADKGRAIRISKNADKRKLRIWSGKQKKKMNSTWEAWLNDYHSKL